MKYQLNAIVFLIPVIFRWLFEGKYLHILNPKVLKIFLNEGLDQQNLICDSRHIPQSVL